MGGLSHKAGLWGTHPCMEETGNSTIQAQPELFHIEWSPVGYCSSIQTSEKCRGPRALYGVGKSRSEIATIMGCSVVAIGTYLNPAYRPKVVPTKTCPVCGETFPAWRNQEHCSRECMMSLTAKVGCVCKHCGESFTVRESEMKKGLVGRGTYCSAVCYHKAISPEAWNGL